MSAPRDRRQADVFAWARAAFTVEQATSLPQRGLRLLEEAAEAFQAAGGDAEMAHRLVDYVFARPVGELRQELGGVGIGVLCLAAAAGISADEAERTEVERVLGKPLEHFRRRNAEKNAAGLLMGPGEARSESLGRPTETIVVVVDSTGNRPRAGEANCDRFLAARKAIFKHVGYVEDWSVLPIYDSRDQFWAVDKLEREWVKFSPSREALTYWLAEHDDEYGPHGDVLYENVIYTQRHLPKWVYRGAELTLVVADTQTDGNKYLQIFRNKNEIRPK